MQDSTLPQKLANAAVTGSWITVIGSHIAEINQWLQFFALVAAIVSSVLASRFYLKRTREKQ